MKKIVYAVLLFVLLNTAASAQTAIWGFGLGGPGGNNYARASSVSVNGNVLVTGYFFGTMNLNPMGTAYNITSNGESDIFLACYTAAGTFLWGFNIGGANYDGGYGITTDIFNNIYICGFFQGGANFNPLGTPYILPFSGGAGSAFEGDGFVAKYNSSGILQWAQDLGGPTQYDYNEALGTDSLGNVYVGGTYSTSMIVSGSITFSTATQGPGYLIKYNPAGTVIWARAFGEFGVAAIATQIRHLVVKGGYVYSAGYFSGTADFQPWSTAVDLTADGGAPNTNAFISKHDTAGNLIFVKQIGGTGGDDEFEGLVLDSLNNIYVSGFTNSPTVTFDFAHPGTSTVTSPGGAADYDITMAKFDDTGKYIWGNVFGSAAGLNRGWCIDIADGDLFLSGQFSGTTQFDPAGSSAGNLVSAGGTDMFLTKYDLNDNYLCGFRVGGAADDIGYGLSHDASGYIYSTGQFEGTAINFEPLPGVFPLTSVSTAGTDGYLVKYDPACISVTIADNCDSIALPDTIKLCRGDTITMPATLYGSDTVLSYTWSPATGLSSTTILDPVITATTSGWYKLVISALIPDDLVDNGNFSAGNTGFTNGYTFIPVPTGSTSPGDYGVGTNPNLYNTAWPAIGDHTTGTGNMLIVDGYPSAGVSFWCQSISVTPNTNYIFSYWSALLHTPSPTIQITINGVVVGGTFTPVSSTWAEYQMTWNSGTASTADICLTDLSIIGGGNDFAVDDISLEPICVDSDSIYVQVNLPDTTRTHTDTSFCSLAGSIVLTAPAGYTNYLWNTGATTSSVTATAGTYWVEDTASCARHVDTFNITLVSPVYVNVEADTSFCNGQTTTLNAPTGYTSPNWSTGSTSSSITVTDTGTYWVHEASNCGGIADTFDVSFRPPVIPNASDTVMGCNYTVSFTSAPGGTQYNYLWTGPEGFDATVQNPIIESGSPANNGVYTVTVVDNATGCSGAATAAVTINPLPPHPLTNITPTQTIDYGSSVQLNADNAIYYWWMPDDGTISNRNINNPIVDPTKNTIYTVYGMDSLGCVDSAKIIVDVIFDSIAIPSAFTPNGDGLNDVFRPLGMKYQSLVEFSVYNRWGQRVFTTNNKEQGWDGTFNGVKQDMDVYNYMFIVALDDGTNRIYKGNVTLIR